jgi:hypothetical protein
MESAERTITRRDLAIAHIDGDSEIKFLVEDIFPTYITLRYIDNDGGRQGQTTNAVMIGDRWQVKGLDVPHTLSFEEYHQGLSELPEINELILLQVDGGYESIMNMCKTEKKYTAICASKYFWSRKVDRDFVAEVSSYKPANITYRQQYKDLNEADIQWEQGPYRRDRLLIDNTIAGRVDILEFLYIKASTHLTDEWNVVPTINEFWIAVKYGHIHVLDWMKKKDIMPANITDDYLGAQSNQWVDSLGDLWFPPSLGYMATMSGHLDVLKWFAQNDLYPDAEAADGAAYRGRIDILEWFVENDIMLTAENALMAVKGGQVKVLQWFYDRDIRVTNDMIDEELHDIAAKHHVDMLKWLQHHGIDISTKLSYDYEVVQGIAESLDLKLLDILREGGYFTGEESYLVDIYREAAEKGNRDIVNWIFTHFDPHDIERTQNEFNNLGDEAAKLKDFATLDILDTYGIYPTQTQVNIIAAKGDFDMLEWLAKRNIFPNAEMTRDTAGEKTITDDMYIAVMDWLVKKGVKLDKSYSLAAQQTRLHLELRKSHKWLSDRGIGHSPQPTTPVHIHKPFAVPQPTVPVPTPQPTIRVPSPQPTIRVPSPQPTIRVPSPQPTIRVPQPTIHVPQPTIRVPSPQPTIHVPQPTIHVPQPTIRVPSPQPTVRVPIIPQPTIPQPSIRVPIPQPTIRVPSPQPTIPQPTIPQPTIPQPSIRVPIPQPSIRVPIPQPSIRVPIPQPSIRVPTIPKPTIPKPAIYKQ